MSVQSLTYAELAETWGISKEAARKKVEGLRLPRRIGNDGKARVQIDLAEVTHQPKASKPETISPPSAPPTGDRQETTAADREKAGRSPSPEVLLLQDRVSELRSDLERERLERTQERDRADRLSQELTETTRRLVALVEEMRDLATIRERLAAADRRHDEIQENHAAELAKAKADLDAWKDRPWWRRLAG